MEFMCKSHMDSCGDTEGEDTSGDECDDARVEINDDCTAESNAIQVEQRVNANESIETATQKPTEVTMTGQASKSNDNTAVPGENVITPEEKLGRHYNEQGLI